MILKVNLVLKWERKFDIQLAKNNLPIDFTSGWMRFDELFQEAKNPLVDRINEILFNHIFEQAR